MIIGKFLDPRAPSLPKQVGINTDDIADILQENEEQSANIQKNTDDIELLKQQVSESGTRVRVDGVLVAEWSPDELTDDLQQLRLAQSSDSLAIVGLQSDNITNKQNIAKLDAETLKTPFSPPAAFELVGIGTNNSQKNISIGKSLEIENDAINLKNLELVWENNNVASGFAAQTLNLDLSNRKIIVVYCVARNSDQAPNLCAILPVKNTQGAHMRICFYDSNTQKVRQVSRWITSTSKNNIVFGAGFFDDSVESSIYAVVPKYIYAL